MKPCHNSVVFCHFVGACKVNKVDALSDVLKTIRLSGSTYYCGGFDESESLVLTDQPKGQFHVVVKGGCWLKQQAEGADWIELKTGDIIAFPTGGAHQLAAMPESSTSNLEPQTNTESSNLTLLCGSFHYDSSLSHPFVKDLPCFIHAKATETPQLDWLRTLVSVIAHESQQPSQGSVAMIDKLTEALFIQLMRLHITEHSQDSTYLAALADEKIGVSLNRIHSEKEAYWTVELLAEKAALSRTAFSEKFTKMVGVNPKAYLTDTRMQRAKRQLEQSSASMISIAEATGYGSEASFSKAFKAFFKVSPGKVRKG